MSPDFAAVVDPIFLHVIGELDKIKEGTIGAPDAVRDRIDNRFRDGDAAFGEKEDWQLAKYALTCWIDEAFKAAPWGGSQWWVNNPLEFHYFRTADAAVQFYVRAKEAAQRTSRDALEVFYVCVALGFRGLYQLEQRAFLSKQLTLPVEIEEWASRARSAIKLGQGRGRFQDMNSPILGAPPLTGKFQLVAAILTAVVLTMFTAVLKWYFEYA